MKYIQIIRPVNLLFIIVLLSIIKYGFLERIELDTTLTFFQFFLFTLSIVCITAGGNVINDLYDVTTDRINKPTKVLIGKKISEKTASTIYIVLTFIGVVLGFFVANSIGKPNLAAVFVITAALLYGYATSLKNILGVSNILIAGLLAFVLITSILFEIYPAISDGISLIQQKATSVLLHFALFAFCINLLREIIKDIQDCKGDKNAGRNTLPIALGQKRTVHLTFGLTVLFLLGLIYYLYTFLYVDQLVMGYFLFCIIGPLLYFLIKLWDVSSPKHLEQLSVILKVIMFLGICAIGLYYKLF